jgi:hypothetical protein
VVLPVVKAVETNYLEASVAMTAAVVEEYNFSDTAAVVVVADFHTRKGWMH